MTKRRSSSRAEKRQRIPPICAHCLSGAIIDPVAVERVLAKTGRSIVASIPDHQVRSVETR
jgi:hypothetical protein